MGENKSDITVNGVVMNRKCVFSGDFMIREGYATIGLLYDPRKNAWVKPSKYWTDGWWVVPLYSQDDLEPGEYIWCYLERRKEYTILCSIVSFEKPCEEKLIKYNSVQFKNKSEAIEYFKDMGIGIIIDMIEVADSTGIESIRQVLLSKSYSPENTEKLKRWIGYE